MSQLFESLESRRLLSVSLTSGVLTVTGTSGNDVIELQKRADKSQVKVELNGSERRFALSSVSKIVVNGLGGSDFIEFSGRDGGLSIRSFIDAGGGNDTVEAGNGNDTILGGAGRDTLEGHGGNDSISGGDFRDLLEGGSGNDTLRGDAGDDRLFGEAGDDSLSGGSGNDDLDGGLGGHDRVAGGSGNDDFSGNDSASDILDRTVDDHGAN